jgi:hypothetical protein
MSEHFTPDDETMTGDRPALDEDAEGHALVQDKAALTDQDGEGGEEDDSGGHVFI